MSDTPRTDMVTRNYVDSSVEWEEELVPVDACRSIERELNAANERIRRLDGRCQALDDQVCNLLEICRQHGVDVSSQDMINGRRKAKEAKP